MQIRAIFRKFLVNILKSVGYLKKKEMKDILQYFITFRKDQNTLRNILEQHVQVQIFGAGFHFTKKF